MSDNNRNGFKDFAAFTIIHGGTAVAKASIIAAALAMRLITKSAARGLSRATANTLQEHKQGAWERYQKTGNLMTAISYLIGLDGK